MSRLLGHLTEEKRQKRKDVRAVRAARTVKSNVSDAAAPSEQFCLQPSLECRQ